MSITLRDALDETMKGWKQALPEPWRPVFKNVSLNSAGVPLQWKHDPWVPIYPVFKDHKDRSIFQAEGIKYADKRNLIGIPYNAHTFRALLVPPEKVRVVIVGQDPYPDIADATGQSFEQGNIRNWVRDAHNVAGSLKSILQLAAADLTGDDKYIVNRFSWKHVVEDLKNEALKLASPTKLFPSYQKQGALWLNTTLSISLFRVPPNQSKNVQIAHAEYWRPFMSKLFEHVVGREGKSVVFGLWGNWAKAFREQIEEAVEAAGTQDRVAFVEASHPVTGAFLSRPKNALTEINEQLTALGGKPIKWFPK